MRRRARRGLDLGSLRGLVTAGLALGAAGGAALCGIVLWGGVAARLAPPGIPASPLRAQRVRVIPVTGLLFPLEGTSTVGLVDSFRAPRSGGRTHHAIDLMAPRGTPVRAVADGRVVRLSSGGAGGLAVYQVDRDGRRGFYYAHLDGIAAGLAEGRDLRQGDRIGVVGTTGNAPVSAPHLHFAAWEVTDPASPWSGRAINPYEFWRVEPVAN
jgi:murein DD-endopeptidase MepM/ murein hydrolase activator NlpD